MSKRAVLILNLGSPLSPSVPDVRRYLREFLGDKRVLDMPAPVRWLLLEGIILRTRPKRSAHAYASIWTPEGSPLLVNSLKVQRLLASKLGVETPVRLAMRYGQPSIASEIARLAADGIEHVLLFPQYPHYAMSSWETVMAKAREEAKLLAPRMRLDCVPPFHADPGYLEALYSACAPAFAEPHDHVLFSYHGLPERHLRKADSSHAHCMVVADCCRVCSPAHATCYRAQCLATTRELVRRAGLLPERHSFSFQSRLAGEPWLEPFTDHELARLPAAGVKRLIVLCPSFTADCLETLEEISIAGRKIFLDAGGESFHRIACLNDHPAFIEFLAGRCRQWLAGDDR